ncbi:MAG: helix-turn-helix domain-containing protein, partial [Treponema sp.]|nr:helix-turn-helix domain-containing protein [Treponema sp.]
IYLYQCHAGLTEAIAPIFALNNDIAGYFMFGQFRVLDQDLSHWQEIQKKVERFVPSISELKNAYLELPSISNEKIAAGTRILTALASSVIANNYIRIQNSPLAVRVEHFILENLDKPLCLSLLSKEFGIGKTSLCTAVRNNHDLSVNELIRKCRLDKAKELLRTSNLSISDIAEKIGVLDYNYFAKLFKKEYGIPPSMFRHLCENEYTQIVESNKDSKNTTGLSVRGLDV